MDLRFLRYFSLSGDVALALQLGHRKADDLELVSVKKFEPGQLIGAVPKESWQVSKRMTISQGSVLMNIEDTSVSFHQPERVMFKPLRTIDGIRLLQVEDLAPRVLDTLTRHGKKKYFYDVYFILRVISIAKLFELYDLKYQRSSAIHILKSLTFFDEAEKDEDPGIFEPTLTWSRVKRTICKEVRNYKMIQKLAAKSQR